MAESDIGGSMPQPLKKNLGPLPVWAWGVILGALIAAYIWFGHSRSGDSADEDSTAAPNSNSLGDAIDGAFRIGGAWNGNSGEGDTNDDSMDTNAAWGFRAVASLVSDGVSPIAAQQAIGNYLDGEALTTEQSALVDKAIRAIGQPPNRPDTPKVGTPKNLTVKSWERSQKGTIYAVMSDGSKVAKTTGEYITAGMPKFASNAYEWQYHKASGNTTTLTKIAARYNTSVENLLILNNWKSIPDIKKGQKVKVPAVKGSGN